MLGFFNKEPAHPLADAKEARRILAEIATREPQMAVEEASTWLESIVTAEEFKPAQRLDLTLRLDEATVAQARRLARDYPAASAGSRAQEARQWELGHGYWRLLIEAYLDCLTRYRSGEKGADAIKPHLTMLYCRLMAALAARLKWDQFRYGPIDPEFWMNSGGIYLAAVAAKLEHKPVLLYANSTTETTIEAEYLKVLVFQATSMDKLKQVQIEIAEYFVAYFLHFFTLTREVLHESIYWVDADKPVPPTRLAKLPAISPTLRFFSATRALEAVNATVEQIGKEGRVPPAISLGAQYEVDAVLPVLAHLAMYWAPKPPMRSSDRRRLQSPLKMVHGMAGVHRRISGYGSDTEGVESWTVDDVSLGGLGAHATLVRSDWLRIGALVGIQPAGGDNWLVGMVRRYMRTGPNQHTIGVETISKVPRAVLADGGGLLTEAILLDVPEVGEYARMALPPNTLEEGVALLFSIDDKKARLHPRETITVGHDFVIANFFVQSYS